MWGIIAFGMVVVPGIAGILACIIMTVLTRPVSHLLANGTINVEVLFLFSLIVGIPASFIGTIVAVWLAAGFRGHSRAYVVTCGVMGAILGLVGLEIVWTFAESISLVGGTRTPPPRDSTMMFIFRATAVLTGCISGAIFGFVARELVRVDASPSS